MEKYRIDYDLVLIIVFLTIVCFVLVDLFSLESKIIKIIRNDRI